MFDLEGNQNDSKREKGVSHCEKTENPSKLGAFKATLEKLFPNILWQLIAWITAIFPNLEYKNRLFLYFLEQSLCNNT